MPQDASAPLGVLLNSQFFLLCTLAHSRKNFLFSDTVRGAEASAAIYSIVVTAKLNGLNQRAYLEWVLAEMPNDPHLREPGGVDRYLPWSDDVPEACRLVPRGEVDEARALPDEPIVDDETLGAALGDS